MALSGSSATARLMAGPDAPSQARRLVADLGKGLPSELVHDAVVATSEIVTNSVQHAGGTLTISIECSAHALAVAVADSSADLPASAAGPTTLADGGRGLRLVAALTDAWGCRPTADGAGKVVWFRIAARGLAGRSA